MLSPINFITDIFAKAKAALGASGRILSPAERLILCSNWKILPKALEYPASAYGFSSQIVGEYAQGIKVRSISADMYAAVMQCNATLIAWCRLTCTGDGSSQNKHCSFSRCYVSDGDGAYIIKAGYLGKEWTCRYQMTGTSRSF